MLKIRIFVFSLKIIGTFKVVASRTESFITYTQLKKWDIVTENGKESINGDFVLKKHKYSPFLSNAIGFTWPKLQLPVLGPRNLKDMNNKKGRFCDVTGVILPLLTSPCSNIHLEEGPICTVMDPSLWGRPTMFYDPLLCCSTKASTTYFGRNHIRHFEPCRQIWTH